MHRQKLGTSSFIAFLLFFHSALIGSAEGGERTFEDAPKSLKDWMVFEQTLNNRANNNEVFNRLDDANQLPQKYLPENRPVFPISNIEIPEEELDIYLSHERIPEQLRFERKGKKYVKFLVHPESKDLYPELFKKYPSKEEFLATPYSSHRSLLIWNPKTKDPFLMVKVSLNREVGEILRILESPWIKRAVGVSAAFKTIDQKTLKQHGILYIDEPVGVVPKAIDAGFQVRNWNEADAVGKDLIPMFSLYSSRKTSPPPLVEMIQKSRIPAKDFIKSKIMEPIIQQSMYLTFEHGITGEPHSQNLLMEVKSGQPTGRYWYRDFGGFGVDQELRLAAGKTMEFLPQGVTAKDLIPRSKNKLVRDFRDYFRHGNLYALEDGLKKHYPEITTVWIDDTFNEILYRELSQRLKTPIRTDRMAQIAMNRLRKSNNGVCLSIIEQIFK